MTIHELLHKRFATKAFDATKTVSEEDLSYVLEAARLSCSSANTQPWKILVITNPDLRAKLREVAYGQPQVTEASHLLVITTMRDPMVRINRNVELITAMAGEEKAKGYLNMVMGWVSPDPEKSHAWLARQTYLALQAMILAAAERGLDSCPMEGFDAAKVNEILGLTDASATTFLPLGYAAQPGMPKVRVPLAEIVERRS